ncbi:MAG: hypothetical protein COB09_16935 [Thalassobium sp.]|nr:MAG: hypothetical protein COB09_16935 [Thalassobium sp.]
MDNETIEDGIAANIELGLMRAVGPDSFQLTDIGIAYAENMAFINAHDEESRSMAAFAAGYRASANKGPVQDKDNVG